MARPRGIRDVKMSKLCIEKRKRCVLLYTVVSGMANSPGGGAIIRMGALCFSATANIQLYILWQFGHAENLPTPIGQDEKFPV